MRKLINCCDMRHSSISSDDVGNSLARIVVSASANSSGGTVVSAAWRNAHMARSASRRGTKLRLAAEER